MGIKKHTKVVFPSGSIELLNFISGQIDTNLTQEDQAHSNASICLMQPGKTLHLTALNTIRKFRKKGDKEGGLAGFRALEKAKLGKVEATNPKRGTTTVSISYYTLTFYFS